MSDAEFASAPPARLKTDYLIIGAGAMGMAFADVVFNEQPSAHITLVDKRARPGGHWNDAYPFVGLHQPAAFYGVSSAKLGTGGSDLSSGPEVVAYYHRAMQRMLASGRVRFLSHSKCGESEGGSAQVVSVLDDSVCTEVEVNKRVVDASYMTVKVPSTHAPRYEVANEVTLIPPNGLPKVNKAWQRYVIIGAGKTAMDAILYLLDRGVNADKIRWIVPNDAWLWDRPSVQPGEATAAFVRQISAIIEHRHVDKIFPALEQLGSIHRIDRDRLPTKWRCATVDPAEVEALRTIKDVVRLGRVEAISANEIQLQEGRVDTDEKSLHVDCTANGLAKLPVRPVFEAGRITLQSLIMCQQVFSAAGIAHITLANMSDEQRNAMCRVVPHPELKEHMPVSVTTSFENMADWNRHFPLWLRRCRLNMMHHDSLWNYTVSAIKAKRLLPKALEVVAKPENLVGHLNAGDIRLHRR